MPTMAITAWRIAAGRFGRAAAIRSKSGSPVQPLVQRDFTFAASCLHVSPAVLGSPLRNAEVEGSTPFRST